MPRPACRRTTHVLTQPKPEQAAAATAARKQTAPYPLPRLLQRRQHRRQALVRPALHGDVAAVASQGGDRGGCIDADDVELLLLQWAGRGGRAAGGGPRSAGGGGGGGAVGARILPREALQQAGRSCCICMGGRRTCSMLIPAPRHSAQLHEQFLQQ